MPYIVEHRNRCERVIDVSKDDKEKDDEFWSEMDIFILQEFGRMVDDEEIYSLYDLGGQILKIPTGRIPPPQQVQFRKVVARG